MGKRAVGNQALMRFENMVNQGRVLFPGANKDLVRVSHVALEYRHMGLKSSMRPLLYSLCLTACAHGPSAADSHKDPDAARDQILKMQERIQDLETRLSALNDKINLENAGKASPGAESEASPDKSIPIEPVKTPPAHSSGVPHPRVAQKAAFASNEAVDRYREAKILYDTGRYGDAILEFSEFLKNEPHHVLASGAQFHLGMSYLKQNEMKLAEEELSRGLISYPHSPFIPDTLLQLAKVSSMLKKEARVEYFKEKISSQFPNSPQAKEAAALHSGSAEKLMQKASLPPSSKTAPMNTALPREDQEPRVLDSHGLSRPEMPSEPSVPTAPVPLEGDSK